MKCLSKNCFVAASAFITCIMTMSGWAQIVTFEFEGYIDNIVKNENNVIEGVYLNQPFTGWFDYSGVPDLDPLDPRRGTYYQDASIVVNLGGHTFPYLDSFIYITTGDYIDFDRFSYVVDGGYGDYGFTWFGLELTDFTSTVFTNDDLPLSLNIEDFDSAFFRIAGDEIATSDFFQIEGQITNIQYVPEPTSLALFVLAGLALRIKRR